MLVLQRVGASVRHRGRGDRRIDHFAGGHQWLTELGVEVVVLDDAECVELLGAFIDERPDLWYEDIGL